MGDSKSKMVPQGNSNHRLRVASGEVNYPHSDWLTDFLYVLMRGFCPPGTVEEVVRELEDQLDVTGENRYTNGWLAQYAHHLANRLRYVSHHFKQDAAARHAKRVLAVLANLKVIASDEAKKNLEENESLLRDICKSLEETKE